MPIDVEGGLISSGGSGLGAMASVYLQRDEPSERLQNHQHA